VSNQSKTETGNYRIKIGKSSDSVTPSPTALSRLFSNFQSLFSNFKFPYP